MADIQFPYSPREWAIPMHKLLASTATRALVCILHRRAGKSYFGVASIVTGALTRPGSYGIIGPHRATMKAIFWPLLQELLADVPGVEFRVGDLQVSVPVLDGSGRKSTISIHSAGDDASGSNIRGLKFLGLFVDEVGNIGADALWGEIWPTQSGLENPWAVFAGTPRGDDALADLFRDTEGRDGWHGIQLGVYDTGLFSAKEIAETKAAMPTDQFLREMCVRLDIGDASQLIKVEDVQAAMQRTLPQAELRDLQKTQPLVAGVDVSRIGDDSVIALRRGHAVVKIIRVPAPIETQALAFRVLNVCREYEVDLLTVDAGSMGIAVIDVMRQLGLFPIGINFGGSADDPVRYLNKRAEIYDRLRAWVEKPNSVLPPDDLRLRKELTATRFKLNASQKLQLEAKASVKARLGTSPDAADALALTFAGSATAPSIIESDAFAQASSRRGAEDARVEKGVDGSKYSSARRTAAYYNDQHQGSGEFDPYAEDNEHGYARHYGGGQTSTPNW